MKHDNLLPASAVAAELAEQRTSGGRSKIYKEISDELRTEMIRADVHRKAQALENYTGRIDLSNLDTVKERSRAYLAACAESGTVPTVLGLATFGFGCSRQWVSTYMRAHPDSPSTRYLEMLKDLFADVLVNASLNRAADSTMGIFVLKNCAGFRDSFAIEAPTKPDPLGPMPSQEELEARFADIVVDDD